MGAIHSDPAAVERTLAVRGRTIPWREYRRVSSTMNVASEIVEEGWGEWMAVSALSQSSGRGTRGREWFSPSGKGMWASVIMPPPADLARTGGLTLAAAESLAEALRELTGARFDIKPPNDIMSRGKKLAGILIESATRGDTVRPLILGMGVDIGQGEQDFRAADLPDATSLLLETGVEPSPRCILETFLERFLPLYERCADCENDSRAAIGARDPRP